MSGAADSSEAAHRAPAAELHEAAPRAPDEDIRDEDVSWGADGEGDSDLDIIVKLPDGTKHIVTMDETDLVQDLKDHIETLMAMGSPPGAIPDIHMRLIFRGKHIVEGNTLKSYGIGDGGKVFVVPGSHGGQSLPIISYIFPRP